MCVGFLVLILSIAVSPVQNGRKPGSDSEYLSWDSKRVNSIAKRMRVTGDVGGSFDFRITSTDKAYNYKLRATLFTPEMIRASARHWQLRERLTDDQTRALVIEAESVVGTVVMVEIDPREGSGVIPSGWISVLKAKDSNVEVKGTVTPSLRALKALSGTAQRDYAYDVFWVVFPSVDENGRTVLPDWTSEVELVVTIYNKRGKVTWKIPRGDRD